MSSPASPATPLADDGSEPPAKRRRESLATQLFGELGALEDENAALKTMLAAAEAKAEEAETSAEAKAAEANQEKAAARRQMDAALEMQLSVLPHCNRYTRAGTKTLAHNDPLRKRLEKDFHASLTRHRGPAQNDPHRIAPKVWVTRVDRICVPRLQEKYLVELQDIAGLCEQKAPTPMTNVKAQRVESVSGLQLNEYLMYHGAPAQLIDRLNLQGLDPRYAGGHFGKLYGVGTYLATNASKSDIYTEPNDNDERCVLLVRACLGEPQLAKEPMRNALKPAERPDGRGACNSVVALTKEEGGAVEHPEFIVYSAWQTLPQYAIWYKHKVGKGCFCTHCVNKKYQVTVEFEGTRKVARISGSNTVLAIKEWAAQAFSVPVDSLGKVINQYGFTNTRVFTSDEETCADANIWLGETIKIERK